MTDTLPSTWDATTIGEISHVKGGKRLPKGHSLIDKQTSNPYLRVTDFSSGRVDLKGIKYLPTETAKLISRYTISSGDIYISIAGSIGIVGQIPKMIDGANLTENAAKIIPAGDIHAPYLVWFLQSELGQSQIREKIKATSQPKLALFRIEELQAPIPPHKEQIRIAEKVGALMERSGRAKEALDATPALLGQYRQSVLAAAFRGDLTKDWREQNPDVEPASSFLKRIRHGRSAQKQKYTPLNEDTIRELPDLPNGWGWAKLPELGELARGKSKHRPRNDPRLFGNEYPFIQTGEVSGAEGYVTTYSKCLSEIGLAQSRLWSRGTVCITIAANIAESAILDIDACFPDSVVGFIADEEATTPEFMEFFIRTAKEDLEAFAPATAQKNINLNTLYDVCVPVPPLEEQQQIVTAVSSAFSMISTVGDCCGQSHERLSILNQSILAKAFRGELVPQDPNDEPASILLDRIRTERAATRANKPKRGRQKAAG